MSESDSEESEKPPPKAKKISFLKAPESEKSTPDKKVKGSRSNSEKSAKSDKSS